MNPCYVLSDASLEAIDAPSRCLVTLFDLPFAGEILSVSPGGSSLEQIFHGAGIQVQNAIYLTLSDPDEVWRDFHLLNGCMLCVERVYGERLDDESLHVTKGEDGYKLLYACVTKSGGWIFSTPVSAEEVQFDHWPTLVPPYGVLIGRVRAMVYQPRLPKLHR